MTETLTPNAFERCTYCGMIHMSGLCPHVKAFEYHPDGRLKRVEFHTPQPIQIVSAGGTSDPLERFRKGLSP